MNGTYIREPDGATLLRFSPRRWNDPAVALRERREAFSIVGDGDWDDDVRNEAQYLAPGEWLTIDGPLMEIGGAMGPMS